MNITENAKQFLTEIGIDPRIVKISSIKITTNKERGTLQYTQHMLNPDGSPKRTNTGHPVATTEARTLTTEEVNRARELGLPTVECGHQWQELETLEYGPTGRVTIYQCVICGEKKHRDHAAKRGD